ncbi:MAG: DUF362 domain-containing protein [Candidatus Poribacteria bacterium]
MEIDKKRCVGCGNCIPWCTMGVISIGDDSKADVNQEECVECENCYRTLRNGNRNPSVVRFIRKTLGLFNLQYNAPVDECPTGALTPAELDWPRTLRKVFSDPTAIHPATGIGGRGTEEIKTNDVTGRLKDGDVGFVVELGRPGIGARFADIERMAMSLAPIGIDFEPKNPVTALMTDANTGKLRDDILDEKVLSAIIEFKTTLDKIDAVLQILEEMKTEVDTVFSVGISAKCAADGSAPYERIVEDLGYTLSLNGKTNLGLGRKE